MATSDRGDQLRARQLIRSPCARSDRTSAARGRADLSNRSRRGSHARDRRNRGPRSHVRWRWTMNHEGIRRHEDHEAPDDHAKKMRRNSHLSVEEERVMRHTIGCAIAVHRALGPGFLESIYQRAMCIELTARGLSYEAERPVRVHYRGVEIPGQRVDLIVGGLIVVELKTVKRLDAVHVGQLISYLKTTGLRGGLLINFRVPLLVKGLKRIVL